MSDKQPRVLSGNLDDIVAEMEREDADGAIKLSPREYARLRGKKPQLIYYYIRTKRLALEQCICGRNVIDVEQADKFFAGEGEASSGADSDADGTEGEDV